MATVNITGKKPDLEVDTIICLKGTNSTNQPKASRLIKGKRGISFTDNSDIFLYVKDLQHANHLKAAIECAINLGWFLDPKAKGDTND